MSDQTQANAIADIALSIPEKPTSRDILAALTKAYRSGFRQGVMAQGRANDAVLGVIGKLMEPRA